MDDNLIFLSGIGITLIVCVIILILLKNQFKKILLDYCGTIERANFWLSISYIILILIPSIFSMTVYPSGNSLDNKLFLLSKQIKWGLIGFVISIITLSFVLITFMPKNTSGKS